MEKAHYSALGDDLLEEALRFLPHAGEMGSVARFRAHLNEALPQSSRLTRERMARFLCRRYFPEGVLDGPFLAVLEALEASETQGERRRLVAYRFIRSEPLIAAFVSEVLFPRLGGKDGVPQQEIAGFVSERLGRENPKTVERLTRALVRTGHLARTNGAHPGYQVRPLLPGFATLVYAFHSELGLPTMYRMEDVAAAPFRRLLLLSAQELQAFLNRAEQDDYLQYVRTGGLEQVRTRLTLAEAVARLTGTHPDALNAKA